ncbi:MAG: phosphoenolpyruvate--protein phosphotransferase [Geminicoccaceae bacterium]|nr:phosphoenolpyruvate--protein phosphotransferase [Geminicoccaceae bacterium]MCB9944070.1 phosphoenolpyruvate--protein phosphotransferase [Geminicoccaceae bacterium]
MSNARRVLKRLIEVVAQPIGPQERLDRIVQLIASNLVAEVCSVYALRAGDVLELFATEGLAAEAVHQTRLAVGEGLVGTIAAHGDIINTDDVSSHPNFAFRPETGEEIYHSFLGVPIIRGGKVAGVVVVQNSARKVYDDDDVDALQVIASILAEMFSSGGIVDRSRYTDVEGVGREPLRLEGLRLVDGIAIGHAWLHAPRIEVRTFIADDPEREVARLGEAIDGLRRSVDEMLERSDLGSGEHREILETYRMFAHDSGWLRRINEAIHTGVTAEAAVRRVQEDTQLRLGHASDPYIRERLLDMDDLANRLLMQLVGRDPAKEARAMPANSIIVARNLSAADVIEYDRGKIRGIVLEEGSSTAHVTVVARAFDVPMVGRVERAMTLIDSGDQVALDGDHGAALVRPAEDVVEAFRRSVRMRRERRRAYDALRGEPSVTRDGIRVSLSINAAFLVDLPELEVSGAEGVGLFRTELAFMARPDFPNPEVQSGYYSSVLDQAGNRPVVFRTLDVGSDKQIPYWRMPEEENPAMGWRALRMLLDRPSILRAQLRAMLEAGAGRELQLMFPMVAEVSEFVRARQLLDLEMERARQRGTPPPATLRVGAMMEVPALYWQLPALLPKVDFISVGSNDLIQFLFACDRGSPSLSDRYDVLSPPALSFLRALVIRCREAGVRLSVCGEMASRPIEAMALVGLGVRHLSLAAAQIGPVKAMVRSLDAGSLATYLLRQLDLPDHSLRNSLGAYARDHAVNLNPSLR